MNLTRPARLPPLLAAALLSRAGRRRRPQQLFVARRTCAGDDVGNGELIYPNRARHAAGRPRSRAGLGGAAQPTASGSSSRWRSRSASPAGSVTELGQTPIERSRATASTPSTWTSTSTPTASRAPGGPTRCPAAASRWTATSPGRRRSCSRRARTSRARCCRCTSTTSSRRSCAPRRGGSRKDDVDDVESRSEKRVNDLYFFPTKVRVSGRQVEFLVPTEFLGGVPSKSWAYTVRRDRRGHRADRGSPSEVGSRQGDDDDHGRGARRQRRSQWGIRGDVDQATPPVIDILAPDPNVQPTVLDDYDTVAGRLAERARRRARRQRGGRADGQAAHDGAGRAHRHGHGRAARPATAPATSPEKRTVPARLRTLNQLLAGRPDHAGRVQRAAPQDPRRALSHARLTARPARPPSRHRRRLPRLPRRVARVQRRDQDGDPRRDGLQGHRRRRHRARARGTRLRSAGNRCCRR